MHGPAIPQMGDAAARDIRDPRLVQPLGNPGLELPARACLADLLKKARARLLDCDVEALPMVNDALAEVARRVGISSWQNDVVPLVLAHEFTAVVLRCPLTGHAFARPRGYPGDAELLDMIYRHPSAMARVDGADAVGRSLFAYTSEVPASRAARTRRETIAAAIDEAATGQRDVEILSVACGHLREVEISQAFRAGSIGRFVGIDRDAASLAIAGGCRLPGATEIETRQLDVRDLLRGRDTLGRFDLIYASGLFDYLDQRTAARLSAALFRRLKAGGRLLIANFKQGLWEAPYLEVFMRWPLIYRSRTEIEAFAEGIATAELAALRYFDDAEGCIGYLELRRT